MGEQRQCVNPPAPELTHAVGVNNHRHFFLYIINLTFGIVLYDWIVYYCGCSRTVLFASMN